MNDIDPTEIDPTKMLHDYLIALVRMATGIATESMLNDPAKSSWITNIEREGYEIGITVAITKRP